MLSQKQLKYLKSLHRRKYRQKYGNFLAEGEKTACEIFRQRYFEIEGVYGLAGWLEDNRPALSFLNPGVVHEISERELKAISLLHTPNRVFIVLKQKAAPYDISELNHSISLYLDEIRDPGNMGTILRIADWFGIRRVFCSGGCVEFYNPRVIQASMGSFLRVRTATVPLARLKEQLPGVPILGMVLDGISVFEKKWPPAALLVVGNESQGIRPASSRLLTGKIAIPRPPGGGAESLNAAVATGIVCAVVQQSRRL
ncbi:MAG TPA: RNA methyltransferase [Bacteroidetes bacterium]|nr:RNA methyltransferase [Bacteroidota bacterium]